MVKCARSEPLSELEHLRAELAASKAELARMPAVLSTSEAMIKHLKLEIAKLRREQYRQSSERHARLIDQKELPLAELEAAATEDEIAAERSTDQPTNLAAFERRRAKPFPTICHVSAWGSQRLRSAPAAARPGS